MVKHVVDTDTGQDTRFEDVFGNAVACCPVSIHRVQQDLPITGRYIEFQFCGKCLFHKYIIPENERKSKHMFSKCVRFLGHAG